MAMSWWQATTWTNNDQFQLHNTVSLVLKKLCGLGHETAAVLLPGFAIKPGNKTAAVSWPDPYMVDSHYLNQNIHTVLSTGPLGTFLSRKCTWKCCLESGSDFV